MNKKILIISILAATIIALAPLSSVVGTDNVIPDTKKDSPLFAVRTQRSHNEENAKNIITKKIGQRHPDIYEKYLGKQGSFIGSEQNNSSVAPEAAPTGKPKIGEVQDGYMFKGGNPADPKNWEKQ